VATIVTLGSVRQLVLDKLRLSTPNDLVTGQPNSNIITTAFTVDQLNRLILEAMEEVTKRTNMPEIYGFLNGGWPVTTPSTQEINLPSDLYKLLRVYVNGKEIPPTSIIDLNQEKNLVFNASWQTYVPDSVNTPLALGDFVPLSDMNGVEFRYYVRRQQPISLGLVPALNVNQSFVIDYVQLPSLPANDAIPLNYPHDFQAVIVEEALWRAQRVLRRHDDADKVQADADRRMSSIVKSISNVQSQYIETLQPYPYNDFYRY
jgi:hypothetical protein